ncbi:MAG: hypothetical protein HKN05_14095 [Rhizobiales bacterium]|nr:hypothetical protein [Hyphomicrobiales bacterium]
MLATLRSKTGGIIAKAFIGLLALSFAVWGINDIFTGYRSEALVTVGDIEISRQDYQNALQQRTRTLSVQLKRSIQSDEIKALGIDRQVLGDLIRQASLDSQAQNLRLSVSDKEIARQIATNPNFQSAGGTFDPRSFRQVLAQAGYSEADFVIQERQRILRSELASAVDQELSVPSALTKAAWIYNNEKRKARYFVLPESAAEKPADPSDSELKTYYENNKRIFTAPEFRTLSLLRLQPEDVAETVSVSEDDLKAAYEKRIGNYSIPEKRTIQQIAFLNKQEADAAYKRISEGTDFLEIAKEKGLTERDYSLGSLTQAAVPDAVIGVAAFALDQGKVSEPINGSLATVIVRVTDIVFGSTQPFEEVRASLEKDLKLERGKEEILNLHDRIEDDRAGGSSLTEIGKALSLPVMMVDGVDRSGKDLAGKSIDTLPAPAAVLKLAFESDVGVENDPVETPEEGFVWVDVVAVTPEALKPFADVKEEATKLWLQSKKNDALRATARKLMDQANQGGSFEAIAKEAGQEIKTTEELTRQSNSTDLGRFGLQALFATPKGKVGMSQPVNSTGMLLFETIDIITPTYTADNEQVKQVATALRGGMSQDLLQQYLVDLQAKLGVNINDRLWSEMQDPNSYSGSQQRGSGIF